MTDFRAIPSIDQLRQRERVRSLAERFGHDAVVDALRAAAGEARSRLSDGSLTSDAAELAHFIERSAEASVRETFRPSLRLVINATGVIIHTNLGRAPLGSVAAQAVADLSVAYCNLEYDLEAGARGSRDQHADRLLCRLTGAESALVVNNNAAATLLTLASLATGREVVISRGELVEIGGGFRVPDVMVQSGAMLREVGTTNKTRIGDYSAAVGERTALILRVHPSNFRIEGFSERPSLAEIVELGRSLNVPVAEDLGSGCLLDASRALGASNSIHEPTVQASLDAGVDLVLFSGDKMLGGPQSGIIVGRRALVDRLRRHPLMRAVRAGKMVYAALETTLVEYQRGRAEEAVPVARMIAMGLPEIERRAGQIVRSIASTTLTATLVPGLSTIGGGSAPGMTLATCLIALTSTEDSADALEWRLRHLNPPVIARIEEDRVVLDPRTVLSGQDEVLVRLLNEL